MRTCSASSADYSISVLTENIIIFMLDDGRRIDTIAPNSNFPTQGRHLMSTLRFTAFSMSVALLVPLGSTPAATNFLNTPPPPPSL